MDKNISTLIAKKYSNLGPLLDIRKAEGYSINSKNYILTFSSGKKALCKYVETDEKNLLSLLRIVQFCEENGAKVPRPLPSNSGSLIQSFGSGLLYLLEFKEGGVCEETIHEIKDFGKEVAILHRILERCEILYSGARPQQRYEHLTEDELCAILNKVQAQHTVLEFDKYVFENVGFFKEKYRSNKEKVEMIDKDKIKYQYIHNDLHPGNVLFKNGLTRAILDLNSIRRGERIRDVAFACYRFAFHNCEENKRIKKRMGVFLDNYKEHNSITNEEERNIMTYFVHECLNRISYILRSHYFYGESEWSFDLKKHVSNIQKAEEVSLDG